MAYLILGCRERDCESISCEQYEAPPSLDTQACPVEHLGLEAVDATQTCNDGLVMTDCLAGGSESIAKPA